MTNARFEAFLAHLYCDAEFAQKFLDEPTRVLQNAGLSEWEQAAALKIDRLGLLMAVDSYAAKRRRPQHRRRWVWPW